MRVRTLLLDSFKKILNGNGPIVHRSAESLSFVFILFESFLKVSINGSEIGEKTEELKNCEYTDGNALQHENKISIVINVQVSHTKKLNIYI